MSHLDLGTVLLIWMLVGALAHEYGHAFMTKICGYKTFGFFANPIPGVLIEHPRKQMHAILMLAGGWIFGVISILLFLPFVAPEYIILFLITALAIETVLSGMGDFMSILAIVFGRYNAKDMWSEYFFKDVAKGHNQRSKYGLSKIAIVDRAKYGEILKDSIQHKHSIAFIDKMDAKGWVVLLSLLMLCSALMVSFVNWGVFGILGLFGVEIEADFSALFWALVGLTFVLTITERLILRYRKK
jgi:hypothetical protein